MKLGAVALSMSMKTIGTEGEVFLLATTSAIYKVDFGHARTPPTRCDAVSPGAVAGDPPLSVRARLVSIVQVHELLF